MGARLKKSLAAELHAAVREFRVAADGCCGDAEHGAAVHLAESAEALAEAVSNGHRWPVKMFRGRRRLGLSVENEKNRKQK